jgi:hypothetical protein
MQRESMQASWDNWQSIERCSRSGLDRPLLFARIFHASRLWRVSSVLQGRGKFLFKLIAYDEVDAVVFYQLLPYFIIFAYQL